MEIATSLNNAIQQMNKKKQEIQAKIQSESSEIQEITARMNEMEQRIETLTNSLTTSEQQLVQLNNTISETEAGYQKIVEAGETLMSIVSQNLPKYMDGETKSDTVLDAFKK